MCIYWLSFLKIQFEIFLVFNITSVFHWNLDIFSILKLWLLFRSSISVFRFFVCFWHTSGREKGGSAWLLTGRISNSPLSLHLRQRYTLDVCSSLLGKGGSFSILLGSSNIPLPGGCKTASFLFSMGPQLKIWVSSEECSDSTRHTLASPQLRQGGASCYCQVRIKPDYL